MRIRFGDFELDEDDEILRLRGERVALEPQVLRALVYLARHSHRLITQDELRRAVWPGIHVTPASVATMIRKARQVVGSTSIKTVHRKGYRFVLTAVGAGEQDNSRRAFVGRSGELARLRTALEAAGSGRGNLSLLVGEQGIGKSRLLEELIADPSVPSKPRLAGCSAQRSTPPFSVWAQVLTDALQPLDDDALALAVGANAPVIAALAQAIAPRLAARPPGAPQPAPTMHRFRVFDSVTSVLRRLSGNRPLMIFLEDLHWIDSDSLALLEFFAHTLSDVAIGIVATVRLGEPDPEALLPRVFALAARPENQRINLTGLNDAESRRLVEAWAGEALPERDRSGIVARGAGNPLFLEQLAQHVGTLEIAPAGADGNALPETLQSLVRERLGRLDAETRALLEIASVLGLDLDLPVLARSLAEAENVAAAEGPARVLTGVDIAREAHLLELAAGGSDAYRFHHALIREVLYQDLAPERRAQLHALVARTMEALSPIYSPDQLSRLADHFVLGAPCGALDKALAYAEEAAQRAVSCSAFELAARHFRQLIEIRRANQLLDDRTHARLLVELARASWRAGDQVASQSYAEQAARLAEQLGDGELLADAVLAIEHSAWKASVDDEQVARVRRADELLPPGDSERRALLLGRHAWHLYHARDRGLARHDLSSRGLAMARRLDSPAVLRSTLLERHLACMDPDHLDERDHLVQELLTLAETSGDAEALAMAYSMRARDRIERGAFSAAEQDMLTALRLGNEVSQPHFRWIHTLWTAVLRMVRGDFAAAEELVATAREEGARIHEPNAMVLAMIQSVVLQLTRGRDAGLDLQLSHIVAASPGIPLTEPALAFVYSRNGREREAVEVAERILAGGIENLPWDTTWLSTLGFLGEVYARAGVVGRCRVLYEILLPYEDRYFVVGIYAAGCAGIVAHTLGVMAMALGNHQQAEAHLRHALERLEANGLRPFVARAHLALGQLLERRGDSGAPAETDRARELAAEIGMDGIG